MATVKLFGFAGHRDECPGRLLACHCFSSALQFERGFNQVFGNDAVGLGNHGVVAFSLAVGILSTRNS